MQNASGVPFWKMKEKSLRIFENHLRGLTRGKNELGDHTDSDGLTLRYFVSKTDGYIADRGGTYLITQSESAQLVVILEFLNTDRTSSAGDFQACDDSLALVCERRRTLALAAGTRLKLVQKGSEGDLLNSRVDVKNTVESSAENALQLQDTDFSLEG